MEITFLVGPKRSVFILPLPSFVTVKQHGLSLHGDRVLPLGLSVHMQVQWPDFQGSHCSSKPTLGTRPSAGKSV